MLGRHAQQRRLLPQSLDAARSFDAPLPFPWVVGLAVLAATAATVVVGRGARVRVRLGTCLAVLAVTVGAGWAGGWAEQTERIEEIRATPVTRYAPVIAGESPQNAEPGCTEEGDVMRNPGEVLSDIALVRGDTALVAQYKASQLDDDALLAALRDAPVVTAEELVG